ncbi:MAG TPA: hypothetical protein PKH33_02995 [bacterium]|nr:hypothetical protein [bacterium]
MRTLGTVKTPGADDGGNVDTPCGSEGKKIETQDHLGNTSIRFAHSKEETMKKSLVITSVLAMAMAFSTIAKAEADFHMNSRFWYTDKDGTSGENRMGLHVVEFSAAAEVDNIGGNLTYRIADTVNAAGGAANTQSYPVETKAYIKFGEQKNHKITAGLQFVPFAIYKWNNLYHPFLDKPGQMGAIWDADWGALYTYNAKPILLDLGYWQNGGERMNRYVTEDAASTFVNIYTEDAEKNTITARLGYDVLSNLNLGASYMTGKIDQIAGDDLYTKRNLWALDGTWKALSNLQLSGEYVDFDMNDKEAAEAEGDFGLLQVKYDINKVPAPLNMVSFVLQYSWLDVDGMDKLKNYQEQIWVKAGKNLDIFWQNVQDEQIDNAGDKYKEKFHYIAFKYSLF